MKFIMFILKYIAIHDLIKYVKNYMLDLGISLIFTTISLWNLLGYYLFKIHTPG